MLLEGLKIVGLEAGAKANDCALKNCVDPRLSVFESFERTSSKGHSIS